MKLHLNIPISTKPYFLLVSIRSFQDLAAHVALQLTAHCAGSPDSNLMEGHFSKLSPGISFKPSENDDYLPCAVTIYARRR